jgi:cell division protein FtsB
LMIGIVLMVLLYLSITELNRTIKEEKKELAEIKAKQDEWEEAKDE